MIYLPEALIWGLMGRNSARLNGLNSMCLDFYGLRTGFDFVAVVFKAMEELKSAARVCDVNFRV